MVVVEVVRAVARECRWRLDLERRRREDIVRVGGETTVTMYCCRD